MATRLKDWAKATTSKNSDDYLALDGATDGSRKILASDLISDAASDYVASPTTHKLAPLNSNNKIDATYLPTSADYPRGAWDASNNSPSLADGTGLDGDYYNVTVAGSANLGSGSITFTVGDVVKYNGTTWFKIDSVANLYDGTSPQAGAATAGDYYQTGQVNDRALGKSASPGVAFTGGAQWILTPQIPANDQVTCHYVVELKKTPSNYLCLGGLVNSAGSGGSGGVAFASLYTDRKLSVWTSMGTPGSWAGDAKLADIATLELDTIYVISVTSDKAGGTGLTVYLNGSQIGNTAITSAANHINTPKLQLGQNNAITCDHKNLGAVVLNRVQSSSEIAAMAKRLLVEPADQWGNGTALIADGDMEAASTTSWETDTSGVTLTKETTDPYEGSKVLRLTHAGTGAAYAGNQYNSTLKGTNIRIRGRARSDGNRTPSIRFNGSTWQTVWTGTTSTSWQEIDFVVQANHDSDVQMVLYSAVAGSASQYVEFDGMEMTAAGAVVALLPTPGSIESDGKWLDSSSNELNGAASGSPTPLSQEPQSSGTWSPGLTFGGGSTGMSITGSIGNWRRVGKLCHFSCRFVVNAKGTSTGEAVFSGLPYTAKNNGSSYYDAEMLQVGASGMLSLTSAVYARINQNATTGSLYHAAATGDDPLEDTNFTNGAVIRISGTYEIE